MPLIVMSHRGPAPLLQGQPGLGAIQSLDLAFLVGAEDQGFVRRIEVEPNHVRQLLDELRIAADLERAGLMRLESVSVPDPMDSFRADADHGSQGTGRPVRGRWRQEGRGEGDDPLDDGRRDVRWATSARSVLFNASQPLLDEPAAPAPDAFAISLQSHRNVFVHEAFGGMEHDLGTQHQARWGAASPSPAGQGLMFLVGKLNGDGNSHRAPLLAERLYHNASHKSP